jgi:hypothetical protein
MEEDHSSHAQQVSLPDQAQFIDHGVPIVISIHEDAVVSASKIRERIEAVALLDRHPCIASVLENKVCVEAGVNDRIRSDWEFQKFIRTKAGAGSDLAKACPTSLSCERNNKMPHKLLHIRSPAKSIGFDHPIQPVQPAESANH